MVKSRLLFLAPLCAGLMAGAQSMHSNTMSAQHKDAGNEAKVQIMPKPGNDQYCLDVKRDQSGNGSLVFTYKCHGGANQKWVEREASGGAVEFVGLDGKCLDVRGTHSRSDGTPVQLWACHSGGNQEFQVGGDGRIKEVASGKCLISTAPKDGAPVVLDDCKNTPDETFDIR